MKLRRRLLAFLAAALLSQGSAGRAQTLISVDNFESYSNNAALYLVWSNFVGSGLFRLETHIVCEGSQALRLWYSVASAPFTNTLVLTFTSPQDWSTFNTFTFSYGGAFGNSTDDVIFQILDHLGGVLGTFIIPGGTAVYPCTDVAVDLSSHAVFTNASHGTNLKDVKGVVLGVVAGASRGCGAVYFDNLVVGYNGNFIGNPGFQDLNGDGVFGDGWISFGQQQFLNDSPNGNPGQATFFSGTNGNAGGVFWPGSPATNGVKYRFTVSAARDDNWNANAQFGVQFLANDNATVLTQQFVTMFTTNIGTTGTTNYRDYSMTATASPGVAYVRPIISYTNSLRTTGSSQRAVFDNAVLAVETSRRLSIVGSSVAEGYNGWGLYSNLLINGSYAGSYGANLTKALATNNWLVVNQSIGGDTTAKVIARFYRDEVPVGADEVFIGLSLGNEGLPGAPNPQAIFDQFYTGITNLIAMSRANNLLPLVGGGYPRNTYTTNEYGYLKRMDLLLNTLNVPSVNFLGATDDGQAHWPTNLYGGDTMHPNDAGHYEMFLCFVPSVFDALMAGKPTPQMSTSGRFLRVLAGPGQPAPLSFTPASTVHCFSVSFRLRSATTGTVASVTLPDSTVHPTVEIMPSGLAYVASSGQVVNSGVGAADGLWHDVVVTHQYVRTQTWFYVDAVLAGTATEQLTPVGFVLGGHGSAASRPKSPALTDYQNWFVHRSVLLAEEVQAQFQGALQQASLEVYAPLDDVSFVPGSAAENRAQSLSVVGVNSTNLYPQSVLPISCFAGQITVSFAGLPNSRFELQRSTRVDFATYTVLTVGNPTTNGLFSFIDANPPSASAFYRLQQR